MNRARTFAAAFRYSIPVLLGFLALGAAYGLVLVDSGLPWWLAPLSSVVIYAGSGQFLALSLFAAGAGPGELILAELLLNARHIAYGISLRRRIGEAGRFKWYLVYALSDETFALLSTLPEARDPPESRDDRTLLMVYISALNQFYWAAGSAVGAAAGTLIPFDFEGTGFALTALFVALMVEQIRRVRKPGPFLVSALVSVLAVAALPPRIALLVSLAVSIVLVWLGGFRRKGGDPAGSEGGAP